MLNMLQNEIGQGSIKLSVYYDKCQFSVFGVFRGEQLIILNPF